MLDVKEGFSSCCTLSARHRKSWRAALPLSKSDRGCRGPAPELYYQPSEHRVQAGI